MKKICDGSNFIEWEDASGISACRDSCEIKVKEDGSGCCEARARPDNAAYCRYYANGRIKDSSLHDDAQAVLCLDGIHRFSN